VQPSCQYPANPLNYSPAIQAVLIDLIEWTTGEQLPPESRWPRMAAGTLVPVEALKGPDLTAMGITWPQVINRPVAPVGTRGWPVRVPKVDADGNDLGGIRMPELSVPAASYVGWNLRKPGFAAGELCSLYGSYFPFAPDASSRGNDPRPSLAERYGATSRKALLDAAADGLRQDRLLLDEGQP